MNREERSLAYITRITPFRESDAVVTLFTRDMGRTTLMARGARNSRKRFGGLLDYFHLVEAIFVPGTHGMGRLSSLDLVRPFSPSSLTLDNHQAAFHMLEIVHRATADADPDILLFQALDLGLETLAQGSDPASAVARFQTCALAALGYALPLRQCPGCSRPFGAEVYAEPDGAIACGRCAPPHARALAQETVAWLRDTDLGETPGPRVPGPHAKRELHHLLGARMDACIPGRLHSRAPVY